MDNKGLYTSCCAYKHCNNSKRNNPCVSFYKFPIKDVFRCRKWIKNCANPSILIYSDDLTMLNSSLLCEIHFCPESFSDNKRLLKNAVPMKYNELQGMYLV